MEYNFKLGDVFPQTVTLLSNSLIPINSPQLKNLGKLLVKERVRNIVDEFGILSADARGLKSVVTSAEKLENGHDKLYVFCDFKKNQVVGFLKVGHKKLFLFDEVGVEHELKAPCILDFYIYETRQRKGAGKYLFDNVLRKEKILVTHFAIDYPTDKMIFFLRKHYKMTQVLPQINSFLLFDGFFDKRPEYVGGKVSRWRGIDDLTDKPLEEMFHFHHERSRLEDSLEYLMEHPHPHKKQNQPLPFKSPLHFSQRRHFYQMHDHNHPICDAADLQSTQCFSSHHHIKNEINV